MALDTDTLNCDLIMTDDTSSKPNLPGNGVTLESHVTAADATHEVVNEDFASSSREITGSGGLNSRSFIGLLLTQFFGAMNDNVFRWVAVLVAQKVLTTSTAIVYGSLCLTVPYLFFTPMGGWLADRYPKKNVIVACKIFEIVIMLLSVWTLMYGNVVALFVIVALLGTQSALFGPAKFGSIPEMLPTSLLSKGNGLMGMTSIIAVGIGTIAGFALFDYSTPVMGAGDWGTVWPAAFAMVGIAIVGTLTSLLIAKQPAADPGRKPALNPLTDAIPAVGELVKDPRLLRTSLGIAFFMFLASLAQQNIDPFGTDILGLTKSDVGLLLGILIAGVGFGSVLAGVWSGGRVELGIVPIGAVGLVLSAMFIFYAGIQYDPALAPKDQFSYWGSCIGLFFLGASSGLYDVPLESYLQFRSDPKTLGKILAGNYILSYLLIIASSGVFILLMEVLHVNPAYVFLIAGCATIPVVAYILWLMPDLAFRFGMLLITRTFYKLRIFGESNIPEKGGALIVSNHVSFMDGIMMMITSSRPVRFIIYADFTEMPFLRRLGKIMNVIPIKADGGAKDLIRSLRTAKEAIKNGELVCIFAEGQLTRTGQMQPFQRGMMKIIQGTDAPIIPAYIHGLWGSIFSHRGGKIFWKLPKQLRYPVDIHFGEPIHKPKDAAQVRQAVEFIGAKAAVMDSTRQPIPARRFIRHSKKAKFRTKIVDSTKVTLTGGKLLTGALAMRRALGRHVSQDGETNIGLYLPPSVGGAVTNMAVALDGKVGVNLNYTLSEEVLNFCVKKAGVKHVLTSRKFLEKKCFNLEGAEFVYLEDIKEKITAIDKVLAMTAAFAVPSSLLEWWLGLTKIEADTPLTIVFTSGSTGEPKGVVLSHGNVGANIEAIDHLLNLTPDDAMLGVLPFFHSFGYTACMWLPMCYDVRGVYHFNPLDAKVVGRLTKENKATILMATPTFLKMYLRRCEKEELESLDLIVVGAEKMPMELAKTFEEKFGVLPTEGYGTTELSPVAAVNIPDHRCTAVYQQGTKLGTVGRPLPGVTAKVVNPDTDEDLGIGNEGLLKIKGPNVMTGYLDEPEKTAEVICDGWYNTGDYAKIDNEGFVTITGRMSRFSKIGGEMVPHIKIEEELNRICEPPDDDDAELLLAVTAVPDANRGERLIVVHKSLCISIEEALKELANTGIPKIWLPNSKSFVEVEQIPVLGTGKLDLKGLKDHAMSVFCSEDSIA